MAEEIDASYHLLDELRQVLLHELGCLVGMCDEVLIELDHLDDLRTATMPNGNRLLGARHARRSAMRARTDAVELCQQARDARQRSTRLGKHLDAAVFRARALIDAARPPQTATALHPRDATRHSESQAA